MAIIGGTRKKATTKSSKATSSRGSAKDFSSTARSVAFQGTLDAIKEKVKPRKGGHGSGSKSHSKPVLGRSTRISDTILKLAEERAASGYRTAPKTIELWARLGAIIEERMTSQDLAALANDELEIVLERKSESTPVSVAEVLNDIKEASKDPAWTSNIVKSSVWYEESPEYPGCLIRVNSESGERALGNFKNGRFKLKSFLKKSVK